MDTPTKPDVIYLAINLETAVERRQKLLQQAQKAGIDLKIVPAFAGKSLTPEDMAGYDRDRRMREFAQELTPNEIGCLLSHLRALREFVATGAPYVLIVEDDAEFADNFAEGMDYLIHHTSGWQVLKLYSERGKTKDITPANALAHAPVRFIFPKKIYWTTVAIMYTREAAQWVLEHTATYWLAWDAQLSYLLLKHKIPYCSVDPNLVVTADPENKDSTIGVRTGKKSSFNLLRYICRRVGVVVASRRKKAMSRYMEKKLSVY